VRPACFERRERKATASPLAAVFCCWLVAVAQAQTNYQRLKSFGIPELSGPRPSSSPLIQGSDGKLYGTTLQDTGTVFTLNKDGIGYTVLHSFANWTFPPRSSNPTRPYVVEGSDGMLYGTTDGGLSCGTAFRMSRDGSAYTVLVSFDGVGDGCNPSGALLEGSDGALYGTTSPEAMESNHMGA